MMQNGIPFDWNGQDKASRSTALHAAAKAGNVATTQALLKSCFAASKERLFTVTEFDLLFSCCVRFSSHGLAGPMESHSLALGCLPRSPQCLPGDVRLSGIRIHCLF